VIVDFHSHVIPPAWGEAQRLPATLTDVGALLAGKEADGIGVTVVSNAMVNLPGAPVDNRSLDRIKQWNAFAQELASDHAGRVFAIGGFNPFGSDEMLDEMHRAVSEGGLRGVLVHSSVDGRFLDADEVADFWALAAELGVPVFIHPPADPAGSGHIRDARVLEFGARASDVALSVAILVVSGLLERHPRLRIACANGGGGLAMLAGRLDVAQRFGTGQGPPVTARPDGDGRPPSSYLDRVYVDSCSYSAPALRCNLEVFGADRVLFGTDFPPMRIPPSITTDLLEQVGVSREDMEKILWRNAVSLLGVEVSPT
jgi:predicted TIM-barrel fold metal-dependent hydrolase